MARKFKRDRFVSASELAQVAHCPLFYYKTINRQPLSDEELSRIKRGNYMHAQMARMAKTNGQIVDPDIHGYRHYSMFRKVINWLWGLFRRAPK